MQLQQHDAEAVARFLREQFPFLEAGERIEIRAFSSSGNGARFRGFFQTPDDAAAYIAGTVPPTVEVYAGVNPRRGNDGTKEGVSRVTWLWCDMDYKHFESVEECEAMLDGFELAPTKIVKSGGGLQVFWAIAPVDAATEGGRVESLLRRLYLRLGNLDAVQDRSRILRVAGTWNNKAEYGTPKPVRQVLYDPRARYTLEEFARCLPVLPTRDHNGPTRETTSNSGEKPTIDDLRSILSFVPPTLSYSEYLAVWMGVASCFPDSDGMALVDEWSSQAREDNGQSSSPRTQPNKHGQFRRSGYGLGTVIHYAKMGGYEPPSQPVPRMIRRRADGEGWRKELSDLRDPPVDELPELWQRAYDYLGPLTTPFPRDWTTGMVSAFASLLFPDIRFENLPLALWFMGVAGQSSGKNAISDPLYEAFSRVEGAGFSTYTSGTPEGMYAALEGTGVSLLCYLTEFGDYLASLRREHMNGAKGVLCNLYDGRSIEHRLSKTTVSAINPRVAIVGTSTPVAVKEHLTRSDLQTGYISRFLVCAPDVRNVLMDASHITDEAREAFTHYLGGKVRALRGVRYATWDGPLGQHPAAYADYAQELGVGTGEIRRFEDEFTRVEVPQGRLLARVKKMAAGFEAGEAVPQVRGNTLFVRESNLLLAILEVRRFAAQAKALYQFVSSSEDEALIAAIETTLARVGRADRRQLMQRTGSKLKDLSVALNFMAEEGLVSIEQAGRRDIYMLRGA